MNKVKAIAIKHEAAVMLLVLMAVLLSQTAPAQASGADQVLIGVGSPGGGGAADQTVNTTIQTVIRILSWVVGVIAVIMIIINGMRFILAQGEPSKIASARSGIIYGLVGVAVVLSAQALVRVVVGAI